MDNSFFFQSPANPKSFNYKGMQVNESDDILVTHVPGTSGAIILMNHPATFIVYKFVSIKVLSGSVSVNGYEITKRNDPIKVFSSEKTGLIEVKTETFERIWKKKEYSSSLEQDMHNITSCTQLNRRILEKFGNATVAIFVERCEFPLNVKFLELYYPLPLQFNFLPKKNKIVECYQIPKCIGMPMTLQFGSEEDKLFNEINVLIRSAKLTESDNPRILVCGPRNTGKSTLLHFLINRILSVYQRAYYLDTDPGQPEFTPPGVVSLTEVKKTIIGPPFCHQQKNTKMMFTGSVSPSFIDLYSKNVFKLAQLYTKKFTDEPLFVNTMGWMDGTGLQCLINTIASVKPTVLIEIVADDETSMFDYRDYLPSSSHYFQICCKHQRKSHFSAKEMREFSLLSHLGQCQSPLLGTAFINEIKPYCVSWDEIPLFIYPGGNVLPSRMVEAVNESIVALCSVPESSILESDIPEFSKTLEPETENECFGYGLVQAVDEKEHLLYIISPLMEQEWSKVNAIVKGNIMVPDALISKQEIFDVPLPYAAQRTKHLPSEDEDLDVSMVSLKYISDTDSPATNLKARASVENYRKSIPKRYRKSLKK